MTKLKSVKQFNDLIYDVGLHQGKDTDFYLKKGFRVVAFEADPDLIEFNKKQFESNIKRNELTIVGGAIVEDPTIKKVNFYKNLNGSVWGTVNREWADRNEKLGKKIYLLLSRQLIFQNLLKNMGCLIL